MMEHLSHHKYYLRYLYELNFQIFRNLDFYSDIKIYYTESIKFPIETNGITKKSEK